jgi:hypothetical protein
MPKLQSSWLRPPGNVGAPGVNAPLRLSPTAIASLISYNHNFDCLESTRQFDAGHLAEEASCCDAAGSGCQYVR